MMSNGNGNFGRNYRFPFTANQWQELEHQALIFKYMVSGMPIPPDLLYSVRRSLDSSSSSTPSPSSKLFLHQPHQHIGWNCFQMGFGRKIDPEPGRCRRTDGKKWRCSKEAYPDSKYCERHMHRGRNRSRKPVEIPTTTTTTASPPLPPPPPLQQPAPPPSSSSSSIITKNTNQSSTSSSPTSHSLSCLTSLAPSDSHHHHHHHNNNNPFLYSPHSSSRPHSGIDLSSQENTTTTNFLLESGNNNNYSHANEKNCYSRSYGQEGHHKEEVDEHVFFSSEVSGSGMRNVSETDSWQLTMGSPLKHRSSSSYLQLNENSRRQKHDHHQHHYYGVLGGGGGGYGEEEDNIKNDTVVVQKKKVMHHFFDEWPPKDKDSWIDDDDGDEHDDDDHSSIKLGINRNHLNPHLLHHHHNHQQTPGSKIQLSISMPTTNNGSISHDFFMTRTGT